MEVVYSWNRDGGRWITLSQWDSRDDPRTVLRVVQAGARQYGVVWTRGAVLRGHLYATERDARAQASRIYRWAETTLGITWVDLSVR